ncbi:MAG: DoxX family membrane protein [Chromatiales bacterium]|nr:DoxX family membrane protein [Chromatiales bacterium]
MSATAPTIEDTSKRRSFLASTGIVLLLILRYLYGLFFTFSTWNKWNTGVLWTDRLQVTFSNRLEELQPGDLGYWFLENIGIPWYPLIAVYVTFAWTLVTIGLMFGLMTRAAALLAAFICVTIGVGGYYDASLIPLTLIPLLIAYFPTGRWFGLDRYLHRRRPDSIWFR